MSLVPANYCHAAKDPKFTTRPTCPICFEIYDNAYLPKVLECGHTICVRCIDQNLKSVVHSIVGEGEVQKHYSCPICRASMLVPDRGANGFSTNFQLTECFKSNDNRLVKCTECELESNEHAFYICKECTIANHNYNICQVLNEESDLNLCRYAVCANCTFQKHNSSSHSTVEFYPLRADQQYQSYVRRVDAISAALREEFANVRTLLASTPVFLSNVEKESQVMVDQIRRAKSSLHQQRIMTRYDTEMALVKQILLKLKKEIGDLNENVQAKNLVLTNENEETEGLACLRDIQSLEEILAHLMPQQTPVESEVEDLEEEVMIARDFNNHHMDTLSHSTYDNDIQSIALEQSVRLSEPNWLMELGKNLFEMFRIGTVWGTGIAVTEMRNIIRNGGIQTGPNGDANRGIVVLVFFLGIVFLFLAVLIKIIF